MCQFSLNTICVNFLPPKNRRTLKTEIADIQKKKRYIHNR